MTERFEAAEDALTQELMNFIEEAVAQILETRTKASFFAWMRAEAPRRLPGLFADLPNEQAARAVAFEMGREIWNLVPLPGAGYRTRPIPRPERNAPCPCGSGQKHKRCCGAVAGGRLELPFEAEDAWALVLSESSEAEVAQLAAEKRVPRALIPGIADRLTVYGDRGDGPGAARAPVRGAGAPGRARCARRRRPDRSLRCPASSTSRRSGRSPGSTARCGLRCASCCGKPSLDRSSRRETPAVPGRRWSRSGALDRDSPVLDSVEVILLLGENRLEEAADRARHALEPPPEPPRPDRGRPGHARGDREGPRDQPPPAGARRSAPRRGAFREAPGLPRRPAHPALYRPYRRGERPGPAGSSLRRICSRRRRAGWMPPSTGEGLETARSRIGPRTTIGRRRTRRTGTRRTTRRMKTKRRKRRTTRERPDEPWELDTYDDEEDDDWLDDTEEVWGSGPRSRPLVDLPRRERRRPSTAFPVLSDLVVARRPGSDQRDPGLREKLVTPLVNRGVAILDASLAAAPQVTLPDRSGREPPRPRAPRGLGVALRRAGPRQTSRWSVCCGSIPRTTWRCAALSARPISGTASRRRRSISPPASQTTRSPYLPFAKVIALWRLQRKDEALAALDEAVDRFPMIGVGIALGSARVPDALLDLWEKEEELLGELKKRVDVEEMEDEESPVLRRRRGSRLIGN